MRKESIKMDLCCCISIRMIDNRFDTDCKLAKVFVTNDKKDNNRERQISYRFALDFFYWRINSLSLSLLIPSEINNVFITIVIEL